MNIFIDYFSLEGTQKYRVGKIPVPFFKKSIKSELIYFSFIAEQKDLNNNSLIPVSKVFVSKEFNLDEAWDRFEYRYESYSGSPVKYYHLREGILKKIYLHLYIEDLRRAGAHTSIIETVKSTMSTSDNHYGYCYKKLKDLIKQYGYSLKEIAAEFSCYTNYNLELYKNMQKMNSNLKRPFYSSETINKIDMKILYIGYDQECEPTVLSSLLGEHFQNLISFKSGDLKDLEDLVIPFLSSSSVSSIFYPEDSHNVCNIFDQMKDDVKIDYFTTHLRHPMNSISNNHLSSRCHKIRNLFHLLKPYIDNQFKL